MFSFSSFLDMPCQPGDALLGSIFARPKIDEKALSDSFPNFSTLRNWAQRSVLASLARVQQ